MVPTNDIANPPASLGPKEPVSLPCRRGATVGLVDERVLAGVAGLLIATGLILRVWMWWSRGELWLDEAALARNIGPVPFDELGQPFRFLQVAPIGFLVTVKALIVGMGPSDRVYRLLPLVGGLLSLPATYLFARRLTSRTLALWATGLVAMCPYATYYASELKPYAGDVFVAAGLLALGGAALDRFRRSTLLALAGSGALATWFSLPAIFVLAAVGSALLLQKLARREWGALPILAGLAVVWLGSFMAHLGVMQTPTQDVEVIGTYWTEDFWPLPPTTLREAAWPLRRLALMYSEPFGYGVPHWLLEPLGGGASLRPLRLDWVAAFVFLVGLFGLRRRPEHLVLLLGPIAYAAVASALHRYPMGTRLVLFLVPTLGVGLVLGVRELARAGRWGAWAGALFGLVTVVELVLSMPLPADKSPPSRNMRGLVARVLEEARPSDGFFVHDDVGMSFGHYQEQLGWEFPEVELLVGRAYDVERARVPPHPSLDEAGQLFDQARVWMLLPTYTPGAKPSVREMFSDFFDARAERLGTWEAASMVLILYRPRPAPAEPAEPASD